MYRVAQSQASFNTGGRSVSLDCFLPESDGQRFPAVISLHGSGGGHATMANPSRGLAAQGFAVYVLHYFDRTGTTEADQKTIFHHFPLWMKTLWDGVSFVEQQAAVDPERVGLLGFSLGAYLSLSSAAIDHRIKAVVDYFGGLPKEMKLFMRRKLPPVLILHGEADATVPVQEAYHLKSVLEQSAVPYEMQIYPGAGHGFNAEVMRDADLRTLNFLKRHLAVRAPA